ncbi:hypothetical protein GCM10023196_037710 [Actinoallomurus vinaceus]|uniref:Resolvase/invertase-type recombinase catalytic domain-containing protein n=2 Tax=Actinoallomurus vinaceus TaxID=1080074 RepID=A0ABP8U9H0_9ACTN
MITIGSANPTETGRTGLRWGIYVRTARSGHADAQEVAVRDMIARVDPIGQVVEVYVDDNVAARPPEQCVEFARMIEDLRASQLNALGAWDIDRFPRHSPVLQDLVSAADQVRVRTVTAADLDASTFGGLWLLTSPAPARIRLGRVG